MIDQQKLQDLLGRAIGDFGGTFHAALVVLGDRLGLYKALAGADPVTPAELAASTGTAERYVREWLNALAEGGTWMIVEPNAGDSVEDNLTPIGRAFYAASTLICTPNALSQAAGPALGAQAGERRIHDVVREAGFSRFRRAAQTPVNLIFEARA